MRDPTAERARIKTIRMPEKIMTQIAKYPGIRRNALGALNREKRKQSSPKITQEAI